jgi:hypothetical protein
VSTNTARIPRVERAHAWDQLVDRMLAELSSGGAREETYWAQQLAFAPVFPHALALRLRSLGWPEAPDDRERLEQVLAFAQAALGALPEEIARVDPASIRGLAQRQASALSVGRRRTLARLMARLGGETSSTLSMAPVPARLCRLYPLIGWLPKT